MQPVRSCEGPVPPRVSSVPTRQTLTRCLQPVTASVRAIWTLFHLNPVFQYRGALLKTLLLCDAPETLSRRSSVRTLPADHFVHNLPTLQCDEPEPSSAGIVGINSVRRLCSHRWRASGMHHLERRLFRLARRSPSVHNLPVHTCEEPVPNSVGIVCADHAGRLRSRCLSALCEYLLPRSSSVPTP